MIPCDYEKIAAMLDQLLENKLIEHSDMTEPLQGIYKRLLKLQTLHQELQQYAVKLSFGEADAMPPPRGNYLAAGLKQLQAQMLHLTWQAQRVAQGDYNQRIDFMGDFSKSFNHMTDQLRQRETRLREQQEAMVTIFDKVEPIFVIDEQESPHILYANKQAAELLGLQMGNAIVRIGIIAQILDIPLNATEHQVLDTETDKWFGISTCKIHWSNHPSAQLFYCHDITLHKERETNLDLAANTDNLTGISNRRALEQSLTQLWNDCLLAEKPLSLIMFDIDNFKIYNDTYGHLEGDQALMYFAGILKRKIGRIDDVIARYGGEEFIILLPFTSQKSALDVAESIRHITEESSLTIVQDTKSILEVSITVSGGVSSIVPSSDYTPAQLIQAADSALYRAKQYGRNKICVQPLK